MTEKLVQLSILGFRIQTGKEWQESEFNRFLSDLTDFQDILKNVVENTLKYIKLSLPEYVIK